MFCFDDFYDPAKSNDCIKGPVMDEAKQGVSNKIFQITSLDAVIRNELKTLTNHLKCYLYLSYFSGGREVSNHSTTAHITFVSYWNELASKKMVVIPLPLCWQTTLNIYQFGNQTALGVKYSDLSVSINME